MVDVAETAMAAAASRALERVVERLVRQVARGGPRAVVAPAPPLDSHLRRDQAIAFLHPRPLDAAQHRYVAMGKDRAQAPCIHAPRDVQPRVGVGPRPRLTPRETGPVGNQRRRGVEAHAVPGGARAVRAGGALQYRDGCPLD